VITETTITDDDEELAGAGPAFQLVAMSPDAVVIYPLPKAGVVSIGRSSKCEVQLDDPMISREHARLHVSIPQSGPVLRIEDAGSANGTRVRDSLLRDGEGAPIRVNEAIMVGSAVLMVLPSRAGVAARRLGSHGSFESRVEEECTLAAQGPHGEASFAVVRVRFDGGATWQRVLPIVARELAPRHVFAVYGPSDYEMLLLGVTEAEAADQIQLLVRTFAQAALTPRLGVAWYLRDGRNADALVAAANARLKQGAGPADKPDAAAEVAPMQRVRQLAARVAASPINVLILGECGVGKDVLANLIHQQSPRAAKPFVAFNCAALSETVLESELFGHERGAFTGASGPKIGLLESANGGTVFLDEIGDMPAAMQAKLLRAIENREIRPVGAVKSKTIDVRFISATNRDVNAAIGRGEFRQDLLDRLNTMILAVPPLRERTDEIETLVTTFVRAACREMGRPAPLAVGRDVMGYLMSYRWPGNIRELKNVIERAVALCDGPEIRPEHLPLEKIAPTEARSAKLTRELPAGAPLDQAQQALPTLHDPAQMMERQRIIDALAACNGNQTRAADLLKMPRRTLVSKLDFYGLPRPQKGVQELPKT
jgi:DNA-binding NtrC family response regulator